MKYNLFLLLILIGEISFAQKIEKEYYSNYHVKYEYEVNGNGVKNGYFKSFDTEGVLYEFGNYNSGLKSGVWTTYGIIEGHPTEISSTMEFDNGKMNGRYIQYCWANGKKYTCGDRIYRVNDEIVTITYHKNGKKREFIDRDKGIYNKWFEDGTPESETINGIRYSYEMKDDGSKLITEIFMDTLGYFIFVDYPFHGKIRNIQVREKSNECARCGNIIASYDFNYFPKFFDSGSKESKNFDSLTYRTAYNWYITVPNANGKNEPCPYNFSTGDIYIGHTDGYYDLEHPTTKAGISTLQGYDAKGQMYFEKLVDGTEISYDNGIIQKASNDAMKWDKEYDESGILKFERIYLKKKEYNSKYLDKYYYSNGKLKYEIGYRSLQDKSGIKKSYYPSGRLKWDFPKSDADTSILASTTFAYADNDLKEIIAIERMSSIYDTVNTEINDIHQVRKEVLSMYKIKASKIYQRFQDSYFVNGSYPKTELVYKKLDNIYNNKLAVINYSTDFALIQLSFIQLLHLQERDSKLILPKDDEEAKILKKEKEEIAILKILGIWDSGYEQK